MAGLEDYLEREDDQAQDQAEDHRSALPREARGEDV
jgi:hypothetical protein